MNSILRPPYTVDPEHSIDLEPRRVREDRARVPSFRSLMAHVRQSKQGGRISGFSGSGGSRLQAKTNYLQRATVRVTYSRAGKGKSGLNKWKAHAKYISRAVAGQVNGETAPLQKYLPGYNEIESGVNVRKTLAHWHEKNDQHVFRMIISPEFGDRIDLQALVRETMALAGRDLGTKLEWVAVNHFNTDHPHAHVEVRGRRDDGTALKIDRDYIKSGLRKRCQEAATNQIGYRELNEVMEAQQRQIKQARFTDLDRALQRRSNRQSDGFHTTLNPARTDLSPTKVAEEIHLWQRVGKLEEMGLAKRELTGDITISLEFETALRQMQRTFDLQKISLDHGVMASDKSMPFRSLKFDDIDQIEGRVLVHGENEPTGSTYTLVESIQGEVLQIPQGRDVIKLRRGGGMQPGSFVRIKALKAEKGRMQIEDLGPVADLLGDEEFLAKYGPRYSRDIPAQYGGWLGKLRAAVDRERGQGR